jgi:hypothetical protein
MGRIVTENGSVSRNIDPYVITFLHQNINKWASTHSQWLLFIQQLPSLEQLSLEICGDMKVYKDKFKALFDLGGPMFKVLRRLRACDICLWIPKTSI